MSEKKYRCPKCCSSNVTILGGTSFRCWDCHNKSRGFDKMRSDILKYEFSEWFDNVDARNYTLSKFRDLIAKNMKAIKALNEENNSMLDYISDAE